MSFLRIAAVVIGLGAVPVLFASAETLSSRVRDAEGAVSGRLLPAQSTTDRLRMAENTAMSRELSEDGVRDRSSAPTFGRIVITPGGSSSFEGRSAPGAEVSLTIGALPLGKTRANDSGVWRLEVPAPLASGDHTISSASKSGDARREITGQDVRIAIPDAFSNQAVVAYEAPAAAPPTPTAVASPAVDNLRNRAEELAAAASQRFTDVTEKVADRIIAQAPTTQAPPAASVTPPRPPKSHSPPAEKQAVPSETSGNERIAAPVFDWLERSAREYQETIIRGLSEPTGGPGPLAASPSPRASDRTTTGDLFTDVQIGVQEWLARANRTYQTEIIRKLEQPVAGSGVAATQPAPARKPADKASAPDRERVAAADAEDQKRRAEAGKREEAERLRAADAKRAAEPTDAAPPRPIEQVVPVSPPATQPPAAAEDVRRKRIAEEEATAKAAETARLAEQKRIEAEAARSREAAERSKAEQQKSDLQARTAAKAAEDARKAAEDAAKRRESEAKRVAEQKAAEDARKVVEDAAKRRESEAKRVVEQKAAEDARKAASQDKSGGNALDLARKAVEQARTGPAKRAAEQQLATELNKSRTGAGPSGAAPAAPAARDVEADQGRVAKSRARPKDDRISEGSGETGPVDLPKTPRASGRAAPVAAASGGTGAPDESRAVGRVAQTAARGRKCARAGRDITPPGTYIIAEGDTLSEIAERHYGTSRRMGRIVKANRRKLRDPDLIWACQRIWLP